MMFATTILQIIVNVFAGLLAGLINDVLFQFFNIEAPGFNFM